MIPSLADLIVDLKNEKIDIVTHGDMSYLVMNNCYIAQIVGDQVRFAPIHLRAASPKFFIKLKNLIECFNFIQQNRD